MTGSVKRQPVIIRDECCTDCLMLIANDDTSGTERCQTEEGEAEYRAEVARRTAGYHWFPSSWPDIDWTDDDRYFGRDCEPAFSWSGCTFCGSSIGGDRHPVSGFETDTPGGISNTEGPTT